MRRKAAEAAAFWSFALVFSALVWWLIGSGLAWLAAQVFQWLNG